MHGLCLINSYYVFEPLVYYKIEVNIYIKIVKSMGHRYRWFFKICFWGHTSPFSGLSPNSELRSHFWWVYETIWVGKFWTQAGCLQHKHPTHCCITLSPQLLDNIRRNTPKLFLKIKIQSYVDYEGSKSIRQLIAPLFLYCGQHT